MHCRAQIERACCGQRLVLYYMTPNAKGRPRLLKVLVRSVVLLLRKLAAL